MIYLYTNTPDESCHEIKGVYGRPVRNDQVGKLVKAGWKRNPEDCKAAFKGDDQKAISLEEMYESRFRKKPHHKMLPENIQKAIDEYDQAEVSKSDPDPAGD